MKNISFLITLIIMLAAGLSIAQQPEPVKVEDGLLQGKFEDGLLFIRGFHLQLRPLVILDGDLLSQRQNGKV